MPPLKGTSDSSPSDWRLPFTQLYHAVIMMTKTLLISYQLLQRNSLVHRFYSGFFPPRPLSALASAGFGVWHQVEMAAFVFPFGHAMPHFFVSFTLATLFGVAFNSVCFVVVFIILFLCFVFLASAVSFFGIGSCSRVCHFRGAHAYNFAWGCRRVRNYGATTPENPHFLHYLSLLHCISWKKSNVWSEAKNWRPPWRMRNVTKQQQQPPQLRRKMPKNIEPKLQNVKHFRWCGAFYFAFNFQAKIKVRFGLFFLLTFCRGISGIPSPI